MKVELNENRDVVITLTLRESKDVRYYLPRSKMMIGYNGCPSEILKDELFKIEDMVGYIQL